MKGLASPGLAFSLLPILFSLTLLGIDQRNRTYGPSHWFVTYQHGFQRRALIGSLFTHVDFLSFHQIILIRALVFLVLATATVLIFRRILFGTFAERRLAAFLLAGPAFLPHMAYMNGELDNFLYLAVLVGAALMMRLQNAFGLLLSTVCCIAGLLMHEAFALMFYPLVLALGIDLVHRGRLHKNWLIANVAVVSAAFFSIIHFGRLAGTVDQWIQAAQRRTDMPIEPTVFQVLGANLATQLHVVARMYTPKLILGLALTLLLAIPYGIALRRMLKASFEARAYSRMQARLLWAIFAVPLVLPILGHDVMRWMSALCINLSLFLLFLYRAETKHAVSAGTLCGGLTEWSKGSVCTATMVFLLSIGPWGYSGNFMLANLSHIFLR